MIFHYNILYLFVNERGKVIKVFLCITNGCRELNSLFINVFVLFLYAIVASLITVDMLTFKEILTI